jgi:hypothetical protein
LFLVQVTGAALFGGLTGFLTIAAIFRFNLMVSTFREGRGGYNPKEIARSFFTLQLEKLNKRKLFGLYLLSILLVGPPIYFILNPPIRAYILAVEEPHAVGGQSPGPVSFLFNVLLLRLVLVIDIGRMLALVIIVKKLTNGGARKVEQKMA